MPTAKSTELDVNWDGQTLAMLPGFPWLPCPICKGTEGCDHSRSERARAALPNLVLPQSIHGQSMDGSK